MTYDDNTPEPQSTSIMPQTRREWVQVSVVAAIVIVLGGFWLWFTDPGTPETTFIGNETQTVNCAVDPFFPGEGPGRYRQVEQFCSINFGDNVDYDAELSRVMEFNINPDGTGNLVVTGILVEVPSCSISYDTQPRVEAGMASYMLTIDDDFHVMSTTSGFNNISVSFSGLSSDEWDRALVALVEVFTDPDICVIETA